MRGMTYGPTRRCPFVCNITPASAESSTDPIPDLFNYIRYMR
jgi:hypothetical protein